MLSEITLLNSFRTLLFHSEAPKLDYGNGQRPLEPFKGVWKGENMKFMMPKSGARYTILNCNYRTNRNELNDLARMVCQKCRLCQR